MLRTLALPVARGALCCAARLNGGAETFVAFRSAKGRDFRGAKGDTAAMMRLSLCCASRLNKLLLPALLFAAVWCRAAEPPKPQDLFDGKSLGAWKVVEEFEFKRHGPVEVKDGRIVLGAGQPGTAIRYPGKLPTMDYELSLEAMRVSGDDFFCGMTFPVGERPLSLIVGGWGGRVVGLSCIDGEPAAENETCDYRDFENGRWYRIRVRVTQPKIEVWIDKDKVVDFQTADKKLTIWFEKECVTPLGIATWRTSAALRNICVTPLSKSK